MINTIINITITAPKKMQYMHFNEEHFSSSKSSIDVALITISQVIRVKPSCTLKTGLEDWGAPL